MLVDCGGTTKRRGSLSKLFRRNSRDSIVAPVVGDKADAGESSRSPVDAVLENGDLAFHLTTFLVGNSAEEEDLSSLCCVSKRWTRTFALARSQLRWDSLRLRVEADEKQGDLLVYHSLSYTLERGGRIGRLTLSSSSLVDACDKAKMEYLRKQLDDSQRDESRRHDNPDYFYEAHRELPTSASFVLPRPPTCLQEEVRICNEVQYDKAPRLVNRYETSLVSDIVGMRNPAMAGDACSEEGSWDLGYHEIVSVASFRTCKLGSRPALGGCSEDSSDFLTTMRAKPTSDPRWMRFCHLVGNDNVREYLRKSLLPLVGPRPSRN